MLENTAVTAQVRSGATWRLANTPVTAPEPPGASQAPGTDPEQLGTSTKTPSTVPEVRGTDLFEKTRQLEN